MRRKLLKVMRLLIYLLLPLLSFCEHGDASGGLSPAARALHLKEPAGNSSDQHQHRQQVLRSSPGSAFTLKVQVNDMLSRKYLDQAQVEIYVNYTRTNSALTGKDGVALLHVPYQLGLPITLVASRGGYIYTVLPCRTSRMPIFSSVTVSLFGLNEGNIWLFEDSVLITGKTSDASSQPIVEFPKSLLNLAEGSDISSVQAYLTLPKLSTEHGHSLRTLGIVSSSSGYSSMELSPVAAVSVQLFSRESELDVSGHIQISRESELDVSGHIQISLPIPDKCGLHTSNAVPAWFFNRTTGGWMRKGLGMVVLVEGKLMWTFTAPHLGYWIAAPLSSNRGLMGLAIPIDFISHHSSVLMVFLGGTLLIVIAILLGLLCYCRSSLGETKPKNNHVTTLSRKDQTTSTCDSQLSQVSSGDSDPKATQLGLVQFDENAVAIRLECSEAELNAGPNDLTSLRETSPQRRVPLSLNDGLFFYNQPVAILHAPAFFHLEEQPDELQWSKSATLPRAAASNNTPTEPPSKDGFTQTLQKGPAVSQNQAVIETEEQLGDLGGFQALPSNLSRGHYSLPESMSVPGTLHQIGDKRRSCVGSELQGNSQQTLAELSKIPSAPPPRAWFVSLEGKPAAEIHHTVAEQQRRRRPTDSRETSLDSGVDMSELNQTAGRRVVTLERNATFVKSSAPSTKPAPPQ